MIRFCIFEARRQPCPAQNQFPMFFLYLQFLLIPYFSFGQENQPVIPVFNVMEYGAVGDGKTLDTDAIQKAIDEATKIGSEAQVLVPAGRQYLIGTLELKSNIDFHLQGDAELLVSINQEDYSGEAAIIANGANELTISGSGSINGRALKFMSHYDKLNELWRPKNWRPKLFILTKCTELKVLNITINKAPQWSLHMLGCENVLVDGIKIYNNLDVPNCDGINPDHCRNVVVRNCEISCGDDAIVVKATRQTEDYGPSANIHVYDCILETHDSGLKIGTETTQDIYNVVFERCKITTSCRGLNIQLRDEGNVFNVVFRDITFTSRYYSVPWWGRGEAISFTAIPRTTDTKIGTIHNILVENVTGTAENSIRINGTKESRINNVLFKNVNVTLNRWTDYPGNLFDNRPTKTYEEIERHDNPGIYIRFSNRVLLKDCSVSWGDNVPDYFTNAIQAHDVTDLKIEGFKGQAAHPDRDQAVVIQDN
jgi:polygalacturonase